MKQTIRETKKISPEIHYLDVFTKILSKGGQISNMCFTNGPESLQISFEYSFKGFPSKFKEEFKYDNERKLISWITTANEKKYSIYNSSIYKTA
ncbi:MULTISPECIES: hypothetical protein [Cytobacillus]|uniref:Uncharacterized protein n=1 Tax=Cytobacillus oceanisediminis 2691 TaxID=1196031 RepID=A0A160M8P1_9BACI|nr:hypothetical protein [Cytobacillus oceanisediminis]AND39019.1 hypothetical protein A361_07770 [Cytobacillus oceanisediminis 2691]MBU8732363.1 hypothetical protein [Cytobacillus oceanisediminis]MDK7666543.1 hypothetical protein [Cytobacillus oceanisediminis]